LRNIPDQPEEVLPMNRWKESSHQRRRTKGLHSSHQKEIMSETFVLANIRLDGALAPKEALLPRKI
jgi:hypothetical protein